MKIQNHDRTEIVFFFLISQYLYLTSKGVLTQIQTSEEKKLSIARTAMATYKEAKSSM